MKELCVWHGIHGNRERLILLATFWLIWKERNRRMFEGIKSNFDKSMIIGSVISEFFVKESPTAF